MAHFIETNMFSSRIVFPVLRMIIGAMFVLSAAMKINSLDQFRGSIIQFNIFPGLLVTPATILIPAIELICGSVLVIGAFRVTPVLKLAIYFLMAILSCFTLAIAVNLLKGNIVECNCFGSLDFLSKISLSKILFNLFMLAALWRISYFKHIRSDIKTDFLNLAIIVCFTSLIINIPLYNGDLKYSLVSESIRTIPIERALELADNQKAILVDTRGETAYLKSHIPGAISIPINTLIKLESNDIAVEINKIILVYCDSKVCGQAQVAAGVFVMKGFSCVYVIKGGYQSWLQYSALRK